MPTMITPVDISTGTVNTWATVDVTAHVGGDAGDIAGVILNVLAYTSEREFGVRHPDSTDEFGINNQNIEDRSWLVSCVGVNSNDEFELWRENAGCKIWLIGYLMNSECTMKVNAVEKVPGSFDTDVVIDISGDTGGDTAKIAMFVVENFGAGELGATVIAFDQATSGMTAQVKDVSNLFIFSGCDANEKMNVNLETNEVHIHLVGWIYGDSVTVLSAIKAYHPGFQAWTDEDLSTDVPADATCAFFQGGDLGSERTMGVRKNGYTGGGSFSGTDTSTFVSGVVEVDSNRVVETEGEDAGVKMFVWGWGKVSVGGAATSIKTVSGLAKASVKTVSGLAIASVKTIMGLE